MIIGYARPYDEDPSCLKQIQQLKTHHCQQIVQETHSSAEERCALENMVENLSASDKIICVKLFALADSSLHLVEILEEIEQKRAFIHSLTEDIDTSTASGCQFTHIVKQLVDFQSDVISEKTKQGLRIAQKKGIITGRPRKPDENVQRALVMYNSRKYSLAEIRQETGISKTTLYRYLES